ncbi:hypothetical protein B0H19DRAFT_951593 [Mycena capillaripes]|nr:hypothetical protein B0H19DRAFT_951593 [Mycena capillaripes]
MSQAYVCDPFLAQVFTTDFYNQPEGTIVDVGSEEGSPGGIYQFNPSTLNAANGTTVTFRFSGTAGSNHSVVQSSFSNPCTPTTPRVDSGFQVVPPNGSLPEWRFNLSDENPLYFFCSQTVPSSHCHAGEHSRPLCQA